MAGRGTCKDRFELPAHCGSREQFDSAVRERLGSEAGALLQVIALSIEGQADGSFALDMQIGGETRHLRDQSCDELFNAAVVVAVVLWQAPSSSSAHGVDAQPAQAVPQANVPVTPPNVVPPPTPLREPRLQGPWGSVQLSASQSTKRHVRLLAGAELGLSAGLQPQAGPFIGVRGALESKGFGLVAGMRWLPPNGNRDENKRGVEVTAVELQVAGYALPIRQLALQLGAAADYLHGAGLGSKSDTSDALWCFGPLLGFSLFAWQGASTTVAVGADAQLQLIRPSFEILQYGNVFQVARVTGHAYLTAGYRF
jgi:hypothetical protein